MMENIFLHLLNMSLTAGFLVVAVVLLRLVFHKAPRWIHCLLWALVAVRLLCPVTFESNLSLMPDTEAAISAVQDAVSETPAPNQSVVIPPESNGSVIDTPTTNDPVVTPPAILVPPTSGEPTIPESSVSAATPEASVDPWQIVVSVATCVWLAGVALLAVYAVATTLRLRRQVCEAARLTDRVWCCDHLRSPFILGVFRPRIYIPSDLSATAQASVLAHEQAHLHRRDHWWKPLGFVLLTVYWFNPLMWVGYVLLCRDIEAACDERVVRDMTAVDRKAYSEALLACSAPRRLVSACPLAFGETSVKSRIKSVLSYKKPTIWIIVAALLISTVAGVCLLTDRPVKVSDALDECIVSTIRDAYATEYADVRYPAVAYTVFDIEKDGDTTTVYGMMMYREYTCTMQGELQGWMMEQSPFILTAKAVDDGYETVDCWWQDKANRETSIRENFPSRYVKKALNFKDYWDTHGSACEADAKAHIADRDKYVFLQPEEADVNVFVAYQQEGDGCYISSQQPDRTRSFFGRYTYHGNVNVVFDLGEIEAAFHIRNGKFVYNEYLSSGIPTDGSLLSDVFYLAPDTVFCEDPSAAPDPDSSVVPNPKPIPTENYWATYSHPIIVGDEGDVTFGCYDIYNGGSETLLPLVKGLEWYGADIMADTAFTAIAYFTFDDGKTYYVSPDKKYLYDGEQIADLTAEQSEQLDYYLREGNPGEGAAAASVTGMVTEWSKEGGYLMLKVTEGDSKLGPKVMVYTGILPPGSAPAVGYSATIYYDGWYDGRGYGSAIYAIHREWADADLMDGPDDNPPTTGTTSSTTTTTAKPTATTTTAPINPDVNKTAAVVFNCTRKNMLYNREVEKLFGASSVVSIDSVDALKALMKSYSDFNLPLYPEYDHNAAFFEEYALLITYYETSSGSARPRAAEYTYSADGTVLTVAVDELWPNNGLVTDDIGEWLMLSVIRKSDLTGVTKLTSGLRSECPENSISFLVNPASDPRHSAEKQSKTITNMETDTLYRILIGSMIDEEWGGWAFPSDVQFDVKLVLYGDTFYYDIDRDIVIATEGETVHYMAWTMCFDKLAKRTNMIDWVLARYSDTNDEVWLWEDFESKYYSNAARVVNTPEMREIALRTNWTTNHSLNRTYDAQYTIGGALYYIDLEHEAVLTADEKQVSILTKEECAYLRSVLDV